MKLTFFTFIFITQSVFAASPVWLVESGQNRLFLAGTIHVLRASDYPLPEAFEIAYKQSQVLAFETDIGEAASPAFQLQLMQAVTLGPEQTLQDFLSPQTYAKLETHFNANKLSIKQFARFKPSMVAMTLTLLELKKLGAGGHGVDQNYFDKAQRDNKKAIALETLQQQIGFIANMGKGQEDLMIQQTLEDIDSLSIQFPSMVKSWRKGDIKQLEELFVKPIKEEFETLYQELLVQRNLNWLPQIFDYMKTPQTEMVLVGSAHLIGEDGLIKHLKQAGYQVTQLN
ncbi:MAG: TraB/GumN family protein [Gammaproteobacteria bacterium]|nr:TraB/GumN family protein [Gammaproteobacteria bacterium]